MENTLTLHNGRLILADKGCGKYEIVDAKGGKVEILNDEAALFVDSETKKVDLVDFSRARIVAEDVFEVEKLNDGRILFGVRASNSFFMYGQNNTYHLGAKYQDGAYFCQGSNFAWRELTDTGEVYHTLWYALVGENELNNRHIVCRQLYNPGYDVYLCFESKGRKYLRKSQASLIYCRVKGEEFVLHFNPNKGEYERISLRRPSMRRRCNEVFANENFIVKNPKSYGDFMAPRTLGEFLYDVKECIAGWCDRFYIKARYNGKWMW